MTRKLQWLIVVWLTILTGVVWVTRPKPLCEELQHLKLTGIETEFDLVREIIEARGKAETASRLATNCDKIATSQLPPQYAHDAEFLRGSDFRQLPLDWRLNLLDEYRLAERSNFTAFEMLPTADASARTHEGSEMTLKALFSAVNAMHTLHATFKTEGG